MTEVAAVYIAFSIGTLLWSASFYVVTVALIKRRPPTPHRLTVDGVFSAEANNAGDLQRVVAVAYNFRKQLNQGEDTSE